MRNCKCNKILSMLPVIVCALSLAVPAWAQMPSTDPATTGEAVSDVSNTVQEIQKVSKTMAFIQKSQAAIGSAVKSVSDFANNCAGKLKEKMAKLQKYKDKVQKYKEKYDKYKKKIDEYKDKAAEYKDAIESGIETAKEFKEEVEQGIETAKSYANEAKETVGALKDTAGNYVDKAKSTVNKTLDQVPGSSHSSSASKNASSASSRAAAPATVSPSQGSYGSAPAAVYSSAAAVETAAPSAVISAQQPLRQKFDAPAGKAAFDAIGAMEPSSPVSEMAAEGDVADVSDESAVTDEALEAIKVGEDTEDTKEQAAQPASAEASIAAPSQKTPVLAPNEQGYRVKGMAAPSQKASVSASAREVPAAAAVATEVKSVPTSKMVAPKTGLRKAFTTSSLRRHEDLAFAIALEMEDDGTDANGTFIISQYLSLYCGLNSKTALEEGRLSECLLKLNKEIRSPQDDSRTEAPKMYNLALAETAAVTMAEAFKAKNDLESFDANVIDPIDLAPEIDAQAVYDNIVEMNKAIDNVMNGMIRLHATRLQLETLKGYGSYGFVPPEEEDEDEAESAE